MMALLRRDPALRAFPRWLVVAPLFMLMVEGLRTLSYFRDQAAPGTGSWLSAVLPAALLWLPIGLFLIFGRVGQRCTRLDLGLPVPARQLRRAHVAASLLAGMAILLSEMIVVWLRRLLVPDMALMTVGPAGDAASLLLAVLATMALGVVVLQAPDATSYAIGAGRSRALIGLAVAGGGLLLVVLLASVLPWYTLFAVLAIAVGLDTFLDRRLPPAFTLQSRRLERPEHGGAAQGSSAPAAPRALWTARKDAAGTVARALTLLRIYTGGIAPGQLFKVPVTLMGIPFLFAWGMFLSGLAIRPEVSIMFLTLGSYMLFAFVPAQAAQIYLVDALPFSRRALFAGLILPGLAVLGVGYVTGAAVKSLRPPVPLVEYQEAGSRMFPEDKAPQAVVRIPYSATRATWQREAPLLRAPWGETHPAWKATLFRDGRLGIYSPYATPEPASREFQALMISRAIADIYGVTVTPAEIQERYLAGAAGDASLERGASTLLADHPLLATPHHPAPAPIYFLVITACFLVMLGLYTRALRASVTDLGRKVAMFSLLGAVLALHVVQLTLAIAGILEIDVLGGLLYLAGMRLAATLPGGVLGLWGLCVLLALPVYLWAQRRFLNIEAPTSPMRCGTAEVL